MFKLLIGSEISSLRSALILSHVGGLLLIFMGGIVWNLKVNDAVFASSTPDFIPYMLIAVGVLRILFTIVAGKGYKIAFYIVILLSILKLIELIPASMGSDFSHISDYLYIPITGVVEIALLWFVSRKSTWNELKESA